MNLTKLDATALVLVIIGGLNWGLVSLGYNLVTGLLGSMPWLVTTVYALVGLSALYLALVFPKVGRK